MSGGQRQFVRDVTSEQRIIFSNYYTVYIQSQSRVPIRYSRDMMPVAVCIRLRRLYDIGGATVIEPESNCIVALDSQGIGSVSIPFIYDVFRRADNIGSKPSGQAKVLICAEVVQAGIRITKLDELSTSRELDSST